MNLKNFLLLNEVTPDNLLEASGVVEENTGEYALSRPTIDNLYNGKRKPCNSTMVRVIRAIKHILKKRGYNAQQITNAMANIEY